MQHVIRMTYDITLSNPDDIISFESKLSGLASSRLYLIWMTYSRCIMSSGWLSWRWYLCDFKGKQQRLLVYSCFNPPITGGFPSQRPATRSFEVFFDLCLNKQLSKWSRRRWFETPSRIAKLLFALPTCAFQLTSFNKIELNSNGLKTHCLPWMNVFFHHFACWF